MRVRHPTKHQPPIAGADRLPRHALLRTLMHDEQAPIVVLLAPAGYGKTTLMGQWMDRLAQQGASASWLGLDEFDNDPVRLTGCVLGALQGWIAGAGASSNAALEAGDWLGALEQIGPMAPAHTLFVDEFEKLTAEPALRAMKLLLGRLPRQVRLVIGSRERPALGLERHRLEGELRVLTANELRFDGSETRHFLDGRMKATLPARLVDRMQALTGGWPAALQLTALAARSVADLERYASDLSGSLAHVADYLAEDVLNAQAPDVRAFLLETCGLPRLNAVVCQAATGRMDSQRLLAHLERHGLFTTALDDSRQWYRYHPLFAEFLRVQQARELAPDQVGAIHRGAARWFSRHGTPGEAVDLWLRAGDSEAAVREMSACARGLMIQAQFGTILRWIGMLEAHGTAQPGPELMLAASWAYGFTGQPSSALRWAGALRQWLSETDAGPAPGLRDDLATLEAVMLAMAGLPEEALRLGMAHWDRISRANRFATGALANVMSYGLMLRGDYAQARAFSNQARLCNEEIGSALGLGYAFAVSSMIEAVQGRLSQALDLFGEVGRVAQRYLPQQWGDHSHLNIASLGLASSLLYEMDELDQAMDLLQRHLPLVMHQPSMDMLLLTFIVHARLHAARGDTTAALEALKAIDQCFPERSQLAPHMAPQIARAHRILEWERFRIEWLAFGAAHALARAPLPVRHMQEAHMKEGLIDEAHPHEGFQTSPGASFVEELCGQGIEAIRYDIVAGRTRPALARLAAEIPRAQASHRRWRLLKLQVLAVLAHDQAGDAAGLADALDQVMALSTETQARRSLFDDGPRVMALLQERLPQRPVAVPHPHQDTGEALLNDREKAILRLVAQGHANEEIAGRIHLSVHTVKWYVRRILEKLDVRNRSEAVFVARQRGLLDG